ncbi:hypothetical protein [Azotobacter salinestris]|uniref:hypothetical protein n=1 Tax=Azotobacter salinestris TaxID=69964 RepID=UPI0032DF9DD3
MTHSKSCRKAAVAPLGLKKAKPSRRVAIHEAGHALAYWWNGQGIYSATARTKAEMRAGPHITRRGCESDLEGIVEAADFIGAPSLALEYGHGMDGGLLVELVARDLLHCASGPVAEAIHRRASLEDVLWAGGIGDLQKAGELLALLPEDLRAEADRQAVARCRELVRRYWPAIEALADLLQEHGRVEGEDVEALLCAVTGELPEFRGNPLADLDKRGARHA